jgi:hypothetical protein
MLITAALFSALSNEYDRNLAVNEDGCFHAISFQEHCLLISQFSAAWSPAFMTGFSWPLFFLHNYFETLQGNTFSAHLLPFPILHNMSSWYSFVKDANNNQR